MNQQQGTNFLGGVTTGVQQEGQRMIIAGVEGIGKTTLACSAPGVLLAPCEKGYASMPVPKTPLLSSWSDVQGLQDELRTAAQRGHLKRGSTVVWDSATALERFIHDQVIRSDPQYSPKNAKGVTMESALGGYGKAYQFANELFVRFLTNCDELSKYGGINTILTCHVFATRVVDPANGEYDQWDLLLHSPKNNKNYGKREIITQWADFVGFLHEPMFVMKATEGEQVRRGISSNQGRMIAVERTPAWVAKNRYGIGGTLPVPRPANGNVDPNTWNGIAGAIYNSCGIDLYNRG